ncbi:unnamed protein product, partial [Mesorhabditis spiculigera]
MTAAEIEASANGSGDEGDSPLEILHARHRQEKKDLKETIQNLRKKAKGGNKKQQKEANEQADSMEKAMKERHEKEVNELKMSELTVGDKTEEASPSAKAADDEVAGEEGPKFYREANKKSKAMLRREKKDEDARRATAAAKEDEENAKNTLKTKEWESMHRILAEKNLASVQIPSDGDCLFGALADQLSRNGKQGLTGKALRKQAAEYLRKHESDFIFFLDEEELGNGKTYAQYCDRVEKDSSLWGGEVEINALAQAIPLEIEVLHADGQVLKFGEGSSDKPAIITYHRHAISLGAHYNSTMSVK